MSTLFGDLFDLGGDVDLFDLPSDENLFTIGVTSALDSLPVFSHGMSQVIPTAFAATQFPPLLLRH